MQRDRIDPAHPCATRLPAPRACAHAARVVGLGAPLCVRIRLEPCERAALRRQLLNHGPGISQPDVTTSHIMLAPVDDTPQAQAWREMLAQLDDPDEDTPVAVLWPTALATPALRGALTDALAAVANCARADDEHAALAHALMTASTLLETLRALLAVDHGGLPEVDL